MIKRVRLEQLLKWARDHKMTPEELEEQQKSWVRGEMAMGLDRDEREARRVALNTKAEDAAEEAETRWMEREARKMGGAKK